MLTDAVRTNRGQKRASSEKINLRIPVNMDQISSAGNKIFYTSSDNYVDVFNVENGKRKNNQISVITAAPTLGLGLNFVEADSSNESASNFIPPKQHWVIDSDDIVQITEVLKKISDRKISPPTHQALDIHETENNTALALSGSVETSEKFISVSLSILGINIFCISVGLWALNYASGLIYIRPVVAMCLAIGGATFMAMDILHKKRSN